MISNPTLTILLNCYHHSCKKGENEKQTHSGRVPRLPFLPEKYDKQKAARLVTVTYLNREGEASAQATI